MMRRKNGPRRERGDYFEYLLAWDSGVPSCWSPAWPEPVLSGEAMILGSPQLVGATVSSLSYLVPEPWTALCSRSGSGCSDCVEVSSPQLPCHGRAGRGGENQCLHGGQLT